MASCYITAVGYRALAAEQTGLWQRRREVVAHLAAAAAEGDRSENAEYQYRKKQLRELDRRIRYLEKRLPELTVVDDVPADRERVFFGAWVEVSVEDGGGPEDADDHRMVYRLVGPDELDPARHWISIDSPVARALIGKAIGDAVRVATPGGAREIEILAIHYTDPEC